MIPPGQHIPPEYELRMQLSRLIILVNELLPGSMCARSDCLSGFKVPHVKDVECCYPEDFRASAETRGAPKGNAETKSPPMRRGFLRRR